MKSFYTNFEVSKRILDRRDFLKGLGSTGALMLTRIQHPTLVESTRNTPQRILEVLTQRKTLQRRGTIQSFTRTLDVVNPVTVFDGTGINPFGAGLIGGVSHRLPPHGQSVRNQNFLGRGPIRIVHNQIVGGGDSCAEGRQPARIHSKGNSATRPAPG